MDSFFSDFFTQFKGLKVSDLLDIYKVSRLRTVKAGELIAKEGDIYSLGVGVIKGLVRTYVIKTDGEEKTIRLNPEKTFTVVQTVCSTPNLHSNTSRQWRIVFSSRSMSVKFESCPKTTLGSSNSGRVELKRLLKKLFIE